MLNFNARSHVCVTQVTCRFVTLKIKGKQALPLYLLFDGEAQHCGLPAYCHLKQCPLSAHLFYLVLMTPVWPGCQATQTRQAPAPLPSTNPQSQCSGISRWKDTTHHAWDAHLNKNFPRGLYQSYLHKKHHKHNLSCNITLTAMLAAIQKLPTANMQLASRWAGCRLGIWQPELGSQHPGEHTRLCWGCTRGGSARRSRHPPVSTARTVSLAQETKQHFLSHSKETLNIWQYTSWEAGDDAHGTNQTGIIFLPKVA